MFDEKEIQKMMKNLSLTREEAIQLLKDDEDDVSVELTAEQKKVVKKMTQGDRKKETTPRKRERKVDETKSGCSMTFGFWLRVWAVRLSASSPKRSLSSGMRVLLTISS